MDRGSEEAKSDFTFGAVIEGDGTSSFKPYVLKHTPVQGDVAVGYHSHSIEGKARESFMVADLRPCSSDERVS